MKKIGRYSDKENVFTRVGEWIYRSGSGMGPYSFQFLFFFFYKMTRFFIFKKSGYEKIGRVHANGIKKNQDC
jgi:hypothetical protein